jgi:ApeA N-terminal domain 1
VEKSQDQYLGEFKIQNRRFPGLVTLKGGESKLELYSDKPIHVARHKMRTISGVARTGEKITICDAIGGEIGGTQTYYETTRHFISFFPHFVAIGPRHLDMDKTVISDITFTTDGAISLFYDHGAFSTGQVRNIRKLMPAWTKKDRREVKQGVVFYYADRGPIFSVKTKDVEFEAFNGVSYRSPSPRGINLTNEVRIRLAFNRPLKLEEAIKAIFEFRGFCEILSQSKHCIHNIVVTHRNAHERESPIRIYPSHEETDSGTETDFRDNLVSGGLDKNEFEKVLAGWLHQQKSHRDARLRVVLGIREGRSYTVDRLVGAANAFDLLPDSTFKKPVLPKMVLETLSKLSVEANKLTQPYRNQVLGNLHRFKGLTLRQKIEGRYRSLPLSLRKRLPEMPLLIDHCVRTRNYFVHGAKPKLSVDATRDLMFLFTDTLEFIFVMAELTDCGWSFDRWIKRLGGTARFKEYIRSYGDAIKEVKKAVAA